MAENLTPQPDISLVRDLLSPYLDGEVTDVERALVEAALADSAQLRAELESLRQTVALVAALPRVAAPHPFTLTEADVQAIAPKPKKLFVVPAWLGGFAAAAALLVCVLAVGGLYWTNQFGSGGAVGDLALAPQQAVEEAAMEQPAAEAPPAEEPAAEAMPIEETAAAKLLVETVQVEQEAAKEVVAEEKVEEAPNPASAPVEATNTAGLLSDTDTAESVGEDRLGMQALPTPTPTALSTTTPTASPSLAAAAAPAEARDAVAAEETSATEREEGAAPEGETTAAGAPEEPVPAQQDDLAQKAEAKQPTATAIALLTLPPPETPKATPAPAEPSSVKQPETFPYTTAILFSVVFILVLVIVVVFIVRRARR
jgi:hypothetical protein